MACGATHTAVTPLDVVKCNMQTDPKNYTGIAQVGAGVWVLGSRFVGAGLHSSSRRPTRSSV